MADLITIAWVFGKLFELFAFVIKMSWKVLTES